VAAGFELECIGQGRGFAGQIARVALRYEPASVNAPATLIASSTSTGCTWTPRCSPTCALAS
jgi:hypothetical protein